MTINAGSYVNPMLSSIKEQLVDLGNGLLGFRWSGYAVATSTPAAYLEIITPSSATGQPYKASMELPANAYITSLIARPEGTLTIGAATGKLRLASAVDGDTATLYAESAAASGGTLAQADFEQKNITPVTIGGTALTFRIYATDGAATDSAVASTVSAASDTKIVCTLSGVVFADGLAAIDFVSGLPRQLTDIVTSY